MRARANLVRGMIQEETKKYVTDEEVVKWLNDHPLLTTGELTGPEIAQIENNLRLASGGREPTAAEVEEYIRMTDLADYPGMAPMLEGDEAAPWLSDNAWIVLAMFFVALTTWVFRKKQKERGNKSGAIMDNLLGSNNRRRSGNDDEYQ